MRLLRDCLCVFIGVCCLRTADASIGDRTTYFRHCVSTCTDENCSTEEALAKFYEVRPFVNRLTRWECEDDCKYVCTWTTVEQFALSGLDVPQFYGKWPFIRWMGMQEPASAVFSLLNMASTIYMFYVFVNVLPKRAPMRYVWITYSMVWQKNFAVDFLSNFLIFLIISICFPICTKAWLWSFIFHTRDTSFSEKMDYFCAIASVMFGFYASLLRIVGTAAWRKPIAIGAVLLGYFIFHVYYLGFVRFDYGYNMKMNVAFGLANSMTWLLWCTYQCFYHKRFYVWRCACVIVCACGLLALELYDFPPLLWTFDAHSLWHLGTSPLPLLWTRFILDDCAILLKQQTVKQKPI